MELGAMCMSEGGHEQLGGALVSNTFFPVPRIIDSSTMTIVSLSMPVERRAGNSVTFGLFCPINLVAVDTHPRSASTAALRPASHQNARGGAPFAFGQILTAEAF